jgi:kinetochore protein Spc7/SPC105
MAILPALEEEHEKVMRELEQEQADVAEIERSDKDYLSELKSSITEQK